MPSLQAVSKSKKSEHYHEWINNHCDCGSDRISYREYLSTMREWDEYFEAVKNTESFKEFWESKDAYANADWDRVAELRRRANERLLDRTYLPKPTRQHPNDRGYYFEYLNNGDIDGVVLKPI